MKLTKLRTYINGLSKAIHADCKNVGWWDDPDRCLYTCLQLVSTEIAEATEGDRKDLWDDHLPGFKMEEVELADALIRVLDLGGHLGYEFNHEKAVSHHWCNKTNDVGKQHLGLNFRVIELAAYLDDCSISKNPVYEDFAREAYNNLVWSIIAVATNRGFDLWPALELKVEYNRSRADHKREARAQEHGKKY